MKEVPILILHGWRIPVERYLPLKKLFLKAKFKVFIPELPGFNENKSLSKIYTLNDYVEFVINFAKQNQFNKFFLVGHSFGGRVAIQLTVLHPEKVKALVLTGVPAVRGGNFKRLVFLILAKIGKAFFAIPPFCLLKQGARKFLYHLIGEWDYYKTKGAMRETFKKIVTEDLTPFLSEIKAPTLLLWGEKDKMVPVSVARKMVAEVPKAKLEIVSGATHKLPYEKPKIFVKKCLDFFERSCGS